MKEKFIKGIFWVISLILLFLGIKAIKSSQHYLVVLQIFSLVIIANPLAMSKLLKMNYIAEVNHIRGLKIMLCLLGSIISLVVAAVIFNKTDFIYGSEAEDNFNAFLRICVYVIYLIIIHLCVSENKRINYIVFGFYYLFCIVLSFLSQDMIDENINILNTIPNGNINREGYTLLVDVFFIPIKEAILTYIIFDTVLEHKDKNGSKETLRHNVKNKDYFPI